MPLIMYSGGVHGENARLDDELMRLIGRSGCITFIPSDSDRSPPYFAQLKRDKARHGIKRWQYFPVDRPFTHAALREAMRSEAIHLSGGNTYYFLKHLRRSGMIPELRSYVRGGGVLCGMSAGSILMTPSILMAGLVSGERDENIVALKNLKALNLVNFEVYPHYKASPISVRTLKRHTRRSPTPVYAFPDGSGIIVQENILSFVGTVSCFRQGSLFTVVS